MAKIVKNIEELVGRTPLFEFEKFEEKHDIKAHLLGKLEYFNPSGSIKDRAALNMIKKAEEDGILQKTPLEIPELGWLHFLQAVVTS